MSRPFDPSILFLGIFTTEIIIQIKQNYIQNGTGKLCNGEK